MAKTLDKDEIMDALSQMSVLDLVELTKMIEEKWGVTAAAPMMAMAAAPAAAAEPQEEKTSFDLVLADVGPNKIQVIKTVREVTSLGLKEAKDLVEAAPKAVKEGISKEEAATIQKKFEEVGAKMELK